MLVANNYPASLSNFVAVIEFLYFEAVSVLE